SWFSPPLACVLLVSCASAPESEPLAKAREVAQYSWERSFEAPAGEWPAINWWTSFEDPQLDPHIVQAVAHATTITPADARVREARYRAQAAGSTLWPSLSATAAAQDAKLTYNGVIPAEVVPHGYNWMGHASLDLSWEIDFWGKNRKALAAAVSETKAT